MIGFEQNIKIKGDVPTRLLAAARNARKTARRALFRVATGQEVQELIRTLSKEPGAPRYPLDWETDKQQRYVMMLLRRRGTLPYGRTHQIAQGWKAGVGKDLSIQVSNRASGVRFVQGKKQQRMHKGRWVYAPTAIRRAAPRIVQASGKQLMRTFGEGAEGNGGRNQ